MFSPAAAYNKGITPALTLIKKHQVHDVNFFFLLLYALSTRKKKYHMTPP